jgi:hypothetical protein
MTTPTRHVVASVLSVASVAACVALALVALDVATGATLQPGSTTSYDTEYLEPRVFALTALLPVVLGVAAAYSLLPALLGTGAVFAVEWWAIEESNQRLAADGWADGLEVLGFLAPIGGLVTALVLVLVGFLVGRRRRRAIRGQDQ